MDGREVLTLLGLGLLLLLLLGGALLIPGLHLLLVGGVLPLVLHELRTHWWDLMEASLRWAGRKILAVVQRLLRPRRKRGPSARQLAAGMTVHGSGA